MKIFFKRELSYLIILITLSVLIFFSSVFFTRRYLDNKIELKEELTEVMNKIPGVHLLWLELSDKKLTKFSYEEFIEYYNTPYKQYYLFMKYRNNNFPEVSWDYFQHRFFFKDALIFIDLLGDRPYHKNEKMEWRDNGKRYISDNYLEISYDFHEDSTTIFNKIMKQILRPEYSKGWTKYFRVISIDELKEKYNYKIDWEFILNQLILNEYYKGDVEQLKFSYQNHEKYYLLEGSILNYEKAKKIREEIKERDLFKPYLGNDLDDFGFIVLSLLFFILFVLRYTFYALKNLKKTK